MTIDRHSTAIGSEHNNLRGLERELTPIGKLVFTQVFGVGGAKEDGRIVDQCA